MANSRRVAWLLLAAAALLVAATLPFGASPVVSAAAPNAGAMLFHEKGCEHCHGVNGAGTERGPNLTAVGRRLHRDEITRQIHDGSDAMPPFGDALDEAELKALTDYLSSRKAKGKSSARAWPLPVSASPAPPPL